MSRSLLAFLLFCLLLVGLSAGVVWYVGPTLAGIVVDGDRRGQPYYVLQVVAGSAPVYAGRSAGANARDGAYRGEFLELAAGRGGRLLWQGGRAEVREGPWLRDVDDVQVLEFATGGDLVQMLTGTDFRGLLQRTGPDRILLLGTGEPPGRLHPGRTTVLVIHQVHADGVDQPLGVPGESGWLSLLDDYGGVLRWRAALEPLQRSRGWNRLLVLQFPDPEAADGWLQDPVTATERAIAEKHLADLLLLVVQPSGFSGR